MLPSKYLNEFIRIERSNGSKLRTIEIAGGGLTSSNESTWVEIVSAYWSSEEGSVRIDIAYIQYEFELRVKS